MKIVLVQFTLLTFKSCYVTDWASDNNEHLVVEKGLFCFRVWIIWSLKCVCHRTMLQNSVIYDHDDDGDYDDNYYDDYECCCL